MRAGRRWSPTTAPTTPHEAEGDDGTAYRPKVERSARCGKLTYSTKKIAKNKAREASRISGDRIEAYHCYPCHGYHIGHVPGTARGVA